MATKAQKRAQYHKWTQASKFNEGLGRREIRRILSGKNRNADLTEQAVAKSAVVR
jgi:hypothetical protein